METTLLFTKPVDEVLLVVSTLKRLGAGKLTTLLERIECQKKQYLAQLFQISTSYYFDIYLHGPYSPSLAHDLFAIEKGDYKFDTERFASDELEERFSRLKQFVEKKSIRMLEIISTVHWFTKAGLSRKDIDKKLADMKQAPSEELEEAYKAIEELPK